MTAIAPGPPAQIFLITTFSPRFIKVMLCVIYKPQSRIFGNLLKDMLSTMGSGMNGLLACYCDGVDVSTGHGNWNGCHLGASWCFLVLQECSEVLGKHPGNAAMPW